MEKKGGGGVPGCFSSERRSINIYLYVLYLITPGCPLYTVSFFEQVSFPVLPSICTIHIILCVCAYNIYNIFTTSTFDYCCTDKKKMRMVEKRAVISTSRERYEDEIVGILVNIDDGAEKKNNL